MLSTTAMRNGATPLCVPDGAHDRGRGRILATGNASNTLNKIGDTSNLPLFAEWGHDKVIKTQVRRLPVKTITLAAMLLPGALIAQEFRGTISGTVVDPQNSLIPNAKIEATETRTGVKSVAVSDTAGKYVIPFLAPGTYRITAEAAGFKGFVQDNFLLATAAHPVLDIHLEVGNASQSVSVTAQAPLLETENGSVAQPLTTRQVEDFPLNGRTPYMLSVLAIGVIAEPNGSGQQGDLKANPWDNSASTTFSSGGAPTGQNEMLIDGAPNSSYSLGIAYNPPVDAVQEVQMQVFSADAAYGHSGGGISNQITKSGTNGFHGSLYEFNQSTPLQANAFFINKAGQKRATDILNQYGITAGGPVFLPKLFNGRNKVFWFFAWEGLHEPTASAHTTTTPTPAERSGDFSALLALGSQYQIYDPSTGVPSGSQIARQPFPGNIIPASRLSPIAQAYMQFFPLPNAAGTSTGLNNYVSDPITHRAFRNNFGRLDFNVSDRQKIFWDIRSTDYNATGDSDYFNNIATGDSGPFRVNWGTTLDSVHTFGPTLFADVRLNWTRFVEDYVNPSLGFNPTSLGYPAYMTSSSESLQIPSISFPSSTFQNLGNTYFWYHNPSDSFQIFGDMVKVQGTHTFKFGVDAREYRMSYFTTGNSTGTFTFGSSWTNGPFSNSAAAPLGQEFAAFLLGLPSSGSYDVNTSGLVQSKYISPFFQDDWRVRSNLTINLGLRFEYETPASERYGRTVNGFDTSVQSPIAGAAIVAYAQNPIPQIPAGQFNVPGGLTFATRGNPAAYQTESHIFSPRFGFAWSPKAMQNTVIRGGFGIFVYPIGTEGGLPPSSSQPPLNQEGFSQTTQMTVTNNNFLTPATTLANPFPNGIQPPGTPAGLATFLGQNITFFNPNVRNPYSIRWNFGFERQLPGDMVLEVVYIGNHSVHLPIAATNLNGIPQEYLSTGLARNQTVINTLTSTVPNPFAGLLPGSTSLNGSTVALSQLLLPYPQFPNGGVTEQYNNAGSSYYESLNVGLQKRLSRGLSFTTSFAWNSLIDRRIYLNAFDAAPEKATSVDSRPIRFVTGATYELPIGNGRLINIGSGWKNALFGGWVVNGIYTWQSGAPLSWGNVIYYGGPLDFDPRQVNGPAFNISQFNTVSAQQLADNVRTFQTYFNNLRADPVNVLDASLLKEFHFSERGYIQVRFETFNTLNRPGFAAPNLTPTSSSFGLITATVLNPRNVQMGARLVW